MKAKNEGDRGSVASFKATYERLIGSIPPETPVTSVNLLRFRAKAKYPKGAGFSPCSGREAYRRYWDLMTGKVAAVGGRVDLTGDVLARLSGGENQAWDAVVAVRYPSFAAFTSMSVNRDGLEAAPLHRAAALLDSLTLLLREDREPQVVI